MFYDGLLREFSKLGKLKRNIQKMRNKTGKSKSWSPKLELSAGHNDMTSNLERGLRMENAGASGVGSSNPTSPA